MLAMWFYGYVSKTIPTYRMLRSKYVKHLRVGKKKISNMKYLVKQVIRATGNVVRHDLVFRNWLPMKVMDLYLGVRHFFAFTFLSSDNTRRY